jgi:predicted RNA-binding Zn-ribbon protein involved in translation (DUF1610 family)
MATKVTTQALCGICKVPLEAIANTHPERFGCPRCGVSDTRQNVLREMNAHSHEAIQRKWESNNKDVRSFDLIKDRVEYEYDLWKPGTQHYY